jgi:hypothetical protein
VGERDILQLWERREEVTGQSTVRGVAVLVLRPDAAAEVVDSVVPAPQNAIVFGHAVVMELVRHVTDALPVAPADVGQLRFRQRFGHQRIVVDRHGVVAVPLQQ